jgi:mono/diheme cytochrome c family protein
MMDETARFAAAAFAVALAWPGVARAGEAEHAAAMAQSLALFKSDVRPALTEHCVSCHGGKDLESLFDLTTREGLLAGGLIGKAVKPGDASASPLLAYLAHRTMPYMPPKKPQLAAETIAKIAQWIDLGAAYDRPLVAKAADKPKAMQVTDADRTWWAYAPLRTGFAKDASIDGFIKAAPEASRRILIRRLSFDITGLPPEPADVEAFVANDAPAAYEQLVDRLLASPRFGERWARHWLDVARYAESHGFEHDYDRKFAFHYRDFVIRAFNGDMPYDQFLRWQLAGDEVAPDRVEALAATGFLVAGVFSTQMSVKDAEPSRYDALDDMLATTGSAMLATTIGCARCHDHKYDPIPVRDYYRMLSIFTTTVRAEIDIPGAAPDTRTGRVPRMMIGSEGEHVLPVRLHVTNRDIPDFYAQTYHLKNGDPQQKEGIAEPGFLQVLTRGDMSRWPVQSRDSRTSGRRAALGNWITDTEQGAGHLAARVIVNRIWQHYMGRGIVGTPNDFGTQGEKPAHPELLDWLASELIRNDWRLKPIHRLIATSAAYRSGERPPRRLEAEAIRDNALSVSGMLDVTMYGPGAADDTSNRRSIYLTVKRSKPVPAIQLFDGPDTSSSQEARAQTTTPSQALHFLNDKTMRGLAEGFAGRIVETPDPVATAYRIAYGRPPRDDEHARAENFIRRQSNLRGGDAGKAYADFCAALMSASEFIFIE